MNKQVQQNSIIAAVFAKLGNEKILQKYSEIIFKLTGLIIDFISAEEETLRISKGYNFNYYCTALRNSNSGRERCHFCDVTNALQAAKKKDPVCYPCYAGLHEVIVPLFTNTGEYIGSLTSGQFHLDNSPLLSDEQVIELAKQHNIECETLLDAYKKSISLTRTQLDGLIQYLQVIGSHLTGTYNNVVFMEKINMPDKIESIRQYLEANYTEDISIEQIAKKFYISPGYLAHKFKETMNVPFQHYINSLRIRKACEMLTYTDLFISEIAAMNGFGSISQFNRVFQAQKGMTPSQYRRKADH